MRPRRCPVRARTADDVPVRRPHHHHGRRAGL